MRIPLSLSLAAAATSVSACTNLLVSTGASVDGSTIVAYNADSGNLYGSLGLYPRADHKQGAMRDVWDWDASTFLGQIPEAEHTLNVVGNTNELGVVIGETTFGGLEELDSHGSGGIMDYGSLIWTTLQRASTAREAIHIMDHLVQTFGYASDGESFFVADGTEVWLMELIGKGKHGKGAVWVAERIPDGKVTATANQARIRTFNHNDSDNTLYAADVVTFAHSIGLYNGTAADFSFSDVYDPVTFIGARACEARVWHLLNPICNGCLDSHMDYAQGYNLTNRMPLFVDAHEKLSTLDTMAHMRTHFEGTWFDPTGTQRADIGAGSGYSPYRWRPMMWESDGHHYVNERTVGTQQTGWSFVAETRAWLAPAIRTAFWFAPDDSSTTLKTPVYGAASQIAPSFGDQVGQMPGAGVDYGSAADAYTMTLDSAFWVFNLVSNIAYGPRSMDVMPVIQDKIAKRQHELLMQARAMESTFMSLIDDQPVMAQQNLDRFVHDTGEAIVAEWRQFWMELFAFTRDGFTFHAPTQKTCGAGETKDCTFRPVPVQVSSGYSKDYYKRIVADGDNSDHYRVPKGADHGGDHLDHATHGGDSATMRANWRKTQRMDKMRV